MNQPCTCNSDPFTWIVDDLGTMVVCFGCRTCGETWTRTAPEPMQRLHRRRMEAQAEKELAEMGWTA